MNYQLTTPKELSFKGATPNGTAFLSRLQQKIGHLELALRDKEAEINKLHSSTKVTFINELKIQTEMYYQEVMRLKNQLNMLQEPHHHQGLSPIQEPLERIGGVKNPTRKFVVKSMENPSQKDDQKLLKSIEKLKEENHRLSAELSSIQSEKLKLSLNLEILQKEFIDKKELEKKKKRCNEGTTQTSPKHHEFISPSESPHNLDVSNDSINLLTSQIDELRRRERAWEEEKATYKDLVSNLKEDRVFFKDISQKRHDELWDVQKELMRLQKEIGSLHVNGNPLYTLENTSNHNSPQGSISSASKPPKAKPSVVSSKRLPVQKNIRKDFAKGTISKSSSPSPCKRKEELMDSERKHALVRGKPISTSASSSCPSSVPQSPSDSNRRDYKNGLKKSCSISSARSYLTSSGSSSSCCSSPSKQISSASKSPRQISLKTKPSSVRNDAKQHRRKFSSSSDKSIHCDGGSSVNKKLIRMTSSQEEEMIANELLKDLNACGLDENVYENDFPKSNDEIKTHIEDAVDSDTGLPSSQSSQDTVQESPVFNNDGELDKRTSRLRSPTESEGSEREEQVSDEVLKAEYKIKTEAATNALLELIESHLSRKKKFIEMAERQKDHKSPQKRKLKKSSTRSLSKSSDGSPSKLSTGSPSKLSTRSPSKLSTRSPSKLSTRSPSKPPKKNSPTKSKSASQSPLKIAYEDTGTATSTSFQDEPQNVKDIGIMLSLLEAHVARKAYLLFLEEENK